MKNIEEQIKVMQHYANGGEVEFLHYTDIGKCNWLTKQDKNNPFNWELKDYRIKEEEKKTVTIEKWLCEYDKCEMLKGSKRFTIIEKVFPFEIGGMKQIKLIETYEVEL